jgi:polyhydroxybutyrate depolymerase
MDHQASDLHYGLISKSESAAFIAVFPNGYSKLPSGKFATWNAGNCCADARDRQVDDVGFVRQLLDQLSSQLNIDGKRIYATGMSNGAMMAYRLACEMPDRFAAIAAVAGTDNTRQCTPKAPIAILHIHAQNDDRVLYNGGAGRKFGDPSQVTDFTSVPATVDQWVQRNACRPQAQRTLTVAGAYCDRYTPCDGKSTVQLCVTEAGGHSWPGGHKALTRESASQAISANDVMWDFFTANADSAR